MFMVKQLLMCTQDVARAPAELSQCRDTLAIPACSRTAALPHYLLLCASDKQAGKGTLSKNAQSSVSSVLFGHLDT